jgi:formate hydrogenlyase subunit 3/multisubunit Na+/H+ antiporter MnhD subunit
MNRLLALILGLVLLLSICYTYKRGLQDGEQHYKQSRRMYMALKSAYHFGYLDAKQGRPEDWDGPDL